LKVQKAAFGLFSGSLPDPDGNLLQSPFDVSALRNGSNATADYRPGA